VLFEVEQSVSRKSQGTETTSSKKNRGSLLEIYQLGVTLISVINLHLHKVLNIFLVIPTKPKDILCALNTK
jgi:hypothetical protein